MKEKLKQVRIDFFIVSKKYDILFKHLKNMKLIPENLLKARHSKNYGKENMCKIFCMCDASKAIYSLLNNCQI